MQKRIENMTEDYVINLIKSLEHKTCDPNVSSISEFNNITNYTNEYKDDIEDCKTLIDDSAFDNSTTSDNNLNSYGSENFKYLNFLNIFIMLVSVMICQLNIEY
jgi:hypothetical protein